MSAPLLISIDIGIQNLAFCIFQQEEHKLPRIVDWRVINLMTLDEHVSQIYKCTEVQKNGTPCCNKAFYRHPTSSSQLCKRHAIQYCSTHFFIRAEDAQFAKKTKRMLIDMCKMNTSDINTSQPAPTPTDKKELWIQFAEYTFKNRVLSFIGPNESNKEEVNMIQIGRNIKKFFDTHEATPLISTVLIENQISPHMTGGNQRLMGATRMKMIQGIIMQYFLVRGNDSLRVEFMASSHKLNQFRENTSSYVDAWGRLVPAEQLHSILSLSDGLKEGGLYRAHKKQANQLCNYLLSEAFISAQRIGEINPDDPEWIHWQTRHASHPKKDDLDDSFLQGLFYILR